MGRGFEVINDRGRLTSERSVVDVECSLNRSNCSMSRQLNVGLMLLLFAWLSEAFLFLSGVVVVAAVDLYL